MYVVKKYCILALHLEGILELASNVEPQSLQ